ncbi:FkbM family methyltransferase [Puniceicoccaceae bacterium K14]|nr:FkbM family methyltransferase [Puniceicoccaceae bacterium K14]
MTESIISSHRLFEIADHVKVSAPANLKLMTPFILLEQGDWFEDEIRWMRRIIEPGMKVLDIGANYGTYSLSAAAEVGTTGKVWSIEPTPSVLEHLERSKAANSFEQMEILPFALGAENGEVSFYVSDNPELNALTQESEAHVEIKVPCRTLDSLVSELGIHFLDFVKLDAEGQEENIVSGGKNVFEKQSPIVLFEIMHGASMSLNCWRALKKLDYEGYTLCPGTNVLVPVDPDTFDGRLTLNMIACKPDRAAQLEKAGHLCSDTKLAIGDLRQIDENFFQSYLKESSYGQALAECGLLDEPMIQSGADNYRLGLNILALAEENGLSSIDKTKYLLLAFEYVRSACAKHSSVARLLTLIRLSLATHRRDIATRLLVDLAKAIQANENLAIDEPFIVPAVDYDEVEVNGNLGEFIQSSILYQRILAVGYSSFYDFKRSFEYLQLHQAQGIRRPKTDLRLAAINQLRLSL